VTVVTNLKVPVHYAMYVAVIYTFYNLLYTVTAEKRETRPEAKERKRENRMSGNTGTHETTTTTNT